MIKYTKISRLVICGSISLFITILSLICSFICLVIYTVDNSFGSISIGIAEVITLVFWILFIVFMALDESHNKNEKSQKG